MLQALELLFEHSDQQTRKSFLEAHQSELIESLKHELQIEREKRLLAEQRNRPYRGDYHD